MDELKARILKDGRVLPGHIIKVDGFLNHRVDCELMDHMADAFAKRFDIDNIDLILTSEASGIPIATICAYRWGKPMIFAKKAKSDNIEGGLYQSEIFSYTYKKKVTLILAKEWLSAGQRVLILDDFMANGEAVKGLCDIVEQAGAVVVGVGIAIEKGFQTGGQSIRDRGFDYCALATIESIDDGKIVFREDKEEIRRPVDMARIETEEQAQAFIDEQIRLIREQVGDKKVLLALSGGVDSSVTAAILIKAIGSNLVCVHVNHGLLRKGEPEQVIRVFRDEMNANLIYVDAVDRFLDKLAGVEDPEQKRMIIGSEFIDVFAEEARKLEGIDYLAQGTIWPDILESEAGIKSHHNAGGLPEDLQFELVEPVRILFKDEVRVVGRALGLPANMVDRQPFPGPGLGVRCPGAITRDRLEAVRESDAILREEFANWGLEGKVWQYFTVVPDFKSTGIRDGKRTFEWPVIVRAVNTKDAMTATVEYLPAELIERLARRITTEVKGVNRLLVDYSCKPSATIEFE